MQYSDTSNFLGIVQEIDYLCFGSSTANTTDYPLVDKARNVNRWYRIVMGIIFESTGNWSFDDLNYTNLPIFPCHSVTGQHDYTFPTGYMDIEMITYRDANGITHKLIPLDRKEITGAGTPESGVIGGATNEAPEEFLKTNGTPKYYDKFANSFHTYPAPDRTSTGTGETDYAFKVYCTRDAAYSSDLTTSNTNGPFVAGDTTREPGFNRMFHPILAFGGAYDYCLVNLPDKLAGLNLEIEKYKLAIKEYYSNRKKDEPKRLIPTYQDNR